MSDQKKGVEFFPTPDDLALHLTEKLFWKAPCHDYDREGKMRTEANGNRLQILEPSAGEGPFAKALTKFGDVTAIDPNFDDPEIENVDWERMSLEDLVEACEGERPFDVAAGNPPFSLAEAHLKLLHKIVRDGGAIGFLLRIGFLSSKGRQKFFAAYPPKHVFILASRPSFMWSWLCSYQKDNNLLASVCGHKWFAKPGKKFDVCPECKQRGKLSVVKTDQYDYMFAVWRVGLKHNKEEPTFSWINTYGEEVDEPTET